MAGLPFLVLLEPMILSAFTLLFFRIILDLWLSLRRVSTVS